MNWMHKTLWPEVLVPAESPRQDLEVNSAACWAPGRREARGQERGLEHRAQGKGDQQVPGTFTKGRFIGILKAAP